jgi:hypothetical protein
MLAMPLGLIRFKALYDGDAIQVGFRSRDWRIIDENAEYGKLIY